MGCQEAEKSKASFVDVLAALRESLLKTVDTINAFLETMVPPEISLEELKQKIPEELRELFTFEVKEGLCIVMPRIYLGAENFAKVANIIRLHGGWYVKAGKDSHFEVPVKAELTA